MRQSQHLAVGCDHGGLFFGRYVGGQPNGAGRKDLRQGGAVGFNMGQGGAGLFHAAQDVQPFVFHPRFAQGAGGAVVHRQNRAKRG